MELKSFFFQPMISYKFNDWASIGGSFIYAKGLVDWDKANKTPDELLILMMIKQQELVPD